MDTLEQNVEREPGLHAVVQARQVWFDFYRTQGYSERQSALLVEQICADRPPHGVPRCPGDRYVFDLRNSRRARTGDLKYAAMAMALSVRDVQAAIRDSYAT